MKKNVFIFLILWFSTISYSQNDTTTISWGKGKILIISEKGDTAVIQKNKNTHTLKKKEKKFKGKWAGFEVGTNGFVTSSGSFALPEKWNYLDLYQPKSVNINFNFMDENITLIEKKLAIVTGLGISWNNYRFNKKTVLSSELDTLSFINDSLVKKSKLVVTNLRLPLLLELHIPINESKDILYVSGGVVGALRTGTYAKYVYLKSGDTKDIKDKSDFFINPFNYSLEFRIGLGDFGVYFNYCPMSLFKQNKGPDIYPWSAGISIVF